jgi:hypothetical protein
VHVWVVQGDACHHDRLGERLRSAWVVMYAWEVCLQGGGRGEIILPAQGHGKVSDIPQSNLHYLAGYV